MKTQLVDAYVQNPGFYKIDSMGIYCFGYAIMLVCFYQTKTFLMFGRTDWNNRTTSHLSHVLRKRPLKCNNVAAQSPWAVGLIEDLTYKSEQMMFLGKMLWLYRWTNKVNSVPDDTLQLTYYHSNCCLLLTVSRWCFVFHIKFCGFGWSYVEMTLH